MLLIDYSQTVIAALFANGINNGKIDEGILRHIVLNTIRSYNRKYSTKYGPPILCCDGAKTWRRDFFPPYKANRKKSRDESSIDWKSLFDLMDKIRLELIGVSPFPVIHLPAVEGDDCIGTLVIRRNQVETIDPVLIISSDKDFGQLQCHPNVSQYSPLKDKMIKIDNPKEFLFEHVIRGDVGDGIPNIFSDDDTLINESKRQTPVTKKRLEAWFEYLFQNQENPRIVTEDTKRNFQRNQKLIDLSFCPKEHQERIIESYKDQINKECNEELFLEYLIENKLKSLIEVIHEFFPFSQRTTKNSDESSLTSFI